MATGGIAKTMRVGSAGQAVPQGGGTTYWDYIYTVSTVLSEKFNIGDRVQLPDGRVFHYAKSGGACWTGRGNLFYNGVPATGIDYKVLTKAAAVGDRAVKTLAILTHTKDDLRGGHALLKVTNTAPDSALQMRLIVGNTAAAIGAEMTIYLDAPLNVALTALSYIVAMPSPYSDIRFPESSGHGANQSYAGIAAVYVDVADKYFWIQTWGECWIAPQGEVGISAKQRDVVFKEDGSVMHKGTTDATWLNGQRAGFILDNNTGLNGMTKMMLQISP